MYPYNVQFLGRERDQARFAEAEQTRLAKIARESRPSDYVAALQTVTQWLGSQMVKWGNKLQDYGPAPLPKTSSGEV
jgi:hypothetical protein